MCKIVICDNNITNRWGQDYIGAECLKIRRDQNGSLQKKKKSTKYKGTQLWKK